METQIYSAFVYCTEKIENYNFALLLPVGVLWDTL